MVVDTYVYYRHTNCSKNKICKGSVAALNVQINHAYPNKDSTSLLNEP